jgi:hypothetical protein
VVSGDPLILTRRLLAAVALILVACDASVRSRPSPLPNVHVSIELKADPSVEGGCCRLVTTSDATESVSAFCDLTVYVTGGAISFSGPVFPGPAGLQVPPGREQEAGISSLPLDPSRDRYQIVCQAVEWHGPPPP